MTKEVTWSAYLEADYQLNLSTSREEAVAEIERRIDCEFPPGELVKYNVAHVISSIEVLNNKSEQIIDAIWDTINDQLAIDTDAEDDPISLAPHDLQQLGAEVVAFITKKGKAEYWTVDDNTVEECVYCAGSNENPRVLANVANPVNMFRQLTNGWFSLFK